MRKVKILMELELFVQDHIADESLKTPVLYYPLPKKAGDNDEFFSTSAHAVMLNKLVATIAER